MFLNRVSAFLSGEEMVINKCKNKTFTISWKYALRKMRHNTSFLEHVFSRIRTESKILQWEEIPKEIQKLQ